MKKLSPKAEAEDFFFSPHSNGLGNERSSKNVNVPRDTIKSIVRKGITYRTAENLPSCGIKAKIPSRAIRT